MSNTSVTGSARSPSSSRLRKALMVMAREVSAYVCVYTNTFEQGETGEPLEQNKTPGKIQIYLFPTPKGCISTEQTIKS